LNTLTSRFGIAMLFLLFSFALAAQKDKKIKPADDKAQEEMALAPDFIEGLKLTALQEIEPAIKKFNECLDKNPNFAPAHYELAELYYEKKDNELCLFHSAKAAEIEPTNKWYLQIYAEANAMNNEFAMAADVYKKLIAAYPENVDYYFDYANMLKASGNLPEAIKALDKLEQKTGLDESLSIEKQRMYIQLNKVDKAAAEIQSLINTYPRESKYYYLLADIYTAAGQKEKAQEVYKRLQAADPENPYALLAIADSQHTPGNDAIWMESLKKAFAHPDLALRNKIQILMSQFNYANGMEEKALDSSLMLAKIMAETHPAEASALSIYADLLYRKGQKTEALAFYNNAAEKDPNNAPVWEQILFLDTELKMNDLLIRDSNRYIELYPNQPLGYYFNGIGKMGNKNYDEAIKVLKKAALIGTDNNALMANIYTQLAEAYHHKKEYALSDQNFDKALELNTGNVLVLNNYAYFLSLRGDRLEDAEKMSQQTLLAESLNPSYLDTYGWILYRMKRYADAEKYLKKALDNGAGESDVVLDHYADVLKALKQNTQAIQYWKRAIEYGGDSNVINEKINSITP